MCANIAQTLCLIAGSASTSFCSPSCLFPTCAKITDAGPGQRSNHSSANARMTQRQTSAGQRFGVRVLWRACLCTFRKTPITARPLSSITASSNRLYLSEFQWTRCSWKHTKFTFDTWTISTPKPLWCLPAPLKLKTWLNFQQRTEPPPRSPNLPAEDEHALLCLFVWLNDEKNPRSCSSSK